MTGVIIMYGICFIGLGILLLICTGKPREDEELILRRARAKRARSAGHVKHRVHYDERIKRHSTTGGYYQ